MRSHLERRERFVQAAIGLQRGDLEKISEVLARWAALAQKRYFAEVHRAIQGHETTPGDVPLADLVQKLSAMFADFESLRLQSQRVRDAIALFDRCCSRGL